MNEGIFKTIWELRKRGYADSTIKGYARKLQTISRHIDLSNPQSVRLYVARHACFKIEAMLEKEHCREGKLEDDYRMALFLPEDTNRT